MNGMFSDPEQSFFYGQKQDTPVVASGAEPYMKMAVDLTPGFGDVMAFKDVAESLSKNEYGEAALNAIGFLPFIPPLGGIIKKVGKKELLQTLGQDEAPKFIDEVGDALKFPNAPLAEAPKNTVKAYKLFRVGKDNQLYPLFVDAKTPVPIGEWLSAKAGDLNTKTGKVKSSLGDLAYRPGWHAGDLPIATHIGGSYDPNTLEKVKLGKGKKPNVREDNQVWAEVEMGADVPWQEEAMKRAQKTKAGKINPRTAHITDQVPFGGHYRYKTNSNMTGNWIIGGEMKVNRILGDDEVKALNSANNVADLPRLRDLATPKIDFVDLNENPFDNPFLK
jgi:hypothetical protein